MVLFVYPAWHMFFYPMWVVEVVAQNYPTFEVAHLESYALQTWFFHRNHKLVKRLENVSLCSTWRLIFGDWESTDAKKERESHKQFKFEKLNYAFSVIDEYELNHSHSHFHVPVCRSQVDIDRLLQGLTAQSLYTLDQIAGKIHLPHQLVWVSMQNAMLHLATRVDRSWCSIEWTNHHLNFVNKRNVQVNWLAWTNESL